MISSVSSANYYVNEGTSHKDITDWIKNDAKAGDNLIFNTSSYNLTNPLNITKSINIKSNKNTQINFYQEDYMYGMLFITAKNVSLSGLTLNHNGNGNFQDYSGGEIGNTIQGTHVNIKNTVINTNLKWGVSILIEKGNIVNCTINSKSVGIGVFKWNGSLINSKIYSKEVGISKNILYPTRGDYWNGNMINSTIVSEGKGVHLTIWKGKIINSTIRSNGLKSDGINIEYAKGSIQSSKIKSINGYAVKITDTVKITNSSLSSRKGLSKVYKYLPDLKVDKAFISGRIAYISISNIGYSTSKPCYVGIKIGKTLKKVPIKSINPLIPGNNQKNKINVEITLPKKLVNNKLKTVKVDYYNKIKERNKKNNVFKFIL